MKRILAIDDSEDFLELLRMLLEDEGHEVIARSHSVEDVHEIERIHPDLIILDLLMGEGQHGGWRTVQALRVGQSTKSLPIILCTAAENSVQQHEDTIRDENMMVVLKPFDIDDLLQSVRCSLA